MKTDTDEAYVYWIGTIIPLNEVDCTHDVKMWLLNRHLTQCRVIAFAANMYSDLQHVFIVCEYWCTGSFKHCQRPFQNKYVEGSVPIKSCIHKLVKKLETTGSVFTWQSGGRKMSDCTLQDVSTCQFSWGTIQKLKSYWGMFGFPSKRFILYVVIH
jgi:hypothetical protein